MNETKVQDNGVVDAEVVPDQEHAAASAQLERRPSSSDVLMPLDAGKVVEAMRAYQALLKDLLDPSDWQSEDKNGRALDRPFPKKSAWRKIARAFNLSVERVSESVERDEAGEPLRAHAVYRAIAPNGSHHDGDGYCSADEARFASWRGRQKLENDLRATATTRAKNRAIADLVGMGEVSAEEMEGMGGAHGAGAEASPQSRSRASRALTYLLEDPDVAERTWGEIKAACAGVMPEAGAQALILAAAALREHKGDGQQATARPREQQGPTLTTAQQRKVMKLCRDHGLVDEPVQHAIYQWVAGEAHLDRIARSHMDALCAAVSDHEATVDEITSRAQDGDRQATDILKRYLDSELQTVLGGAGDAA